MEFACSPLVCFSSLGTSVYSHSPDTCINVDWRLFPALLLICTGDANRASMPPFKDDGLKIPIIVLVFGQ